MYRGACKFISQDLKVLKCIIYSEPNLTNSAHDPKQSVDVSVS